MHAVASCDAAHQLTVHISKRYAEAVILHLAAHLEVFSLQSALHGVVPFCHILLVVSIGKREHRIFVCHLREVLVKVATHAL